MKTIFITIFQAVEAKNILRTSVATALLRDPDVALVCLVPSEDRKAYYEREIVHPRISYEVLSPEPRGLAERFFSMLKFHLIRTATMDLKRTLRRADGGSALGYAMNLAANRLLARPFVRGIARSLDAHVVTDRNVERVLRDRKPSLIFLAHLFDDLEISILREAKRLGIPTIGFINSWDKVTARCMIRLLPDRLLVFNALVRDEAVAHADMPEERITLVGIPQYDYYRTTVPRARAAFAAAFGIAPERRIIVFAPNGRYSARADGAMIDLLHGWIEEGAIPNAALLVRFQPNDAVDRREIERRPWLIYDIPGKRFGSERGGDWDMDERDLARLRDTLAHAAVVVCYTSSLSVDAAVFDRPVINVNFDLVRIPKRSESPIQYYGMTHYQNALATGGIRVVSDRDSLLAWINRYLEHPECDAAGRERLVRKQCHVCDGRAGERMAARILETL